MVRVWELADPAAITRSARAIELALRRALGAIDRDRHRVTVAPGFIEHEDTKGLWRTGLGALPSAIQAKAFALNAIASVTKALSPGGDPVLAQVALGPMLLVPPRVQPVDLFRVAAPGGSWDHWLLRARPRLKLRVDDATWADVFGAQVDVRIGPGGALLGYLCRWRPVLDEYADVGLTPPPPNEDPAKPREQGVVYVLAGDATPQHYLAPYWAIDHGHELELASACQFALTVDIVRSSEGDPTQYVAVVDGGSGIYGFDWGLLPMSDIGGSGLVELGGGQTSIDRSTAAPSTVGVVTLPAGAHIVMVNVVDRVSGAFQHRAQQIYVAGGPDEGAGVA
jgi:hypothetical protein